MACKAPGTGTREDGRETKERIIQAAGPLFAPGSCQHDE